MRLRGCTVLGLAGAVLAYSLWFGCIAVVRSEAYYYGRTSNHVFFVTRVFLSELIPEDPFRKSFPQGPEEQGKILQRPLCTAQQVASGHFADCNLIRFDYELDDQYCRVTPFMKHVFYLSIGRRAVTCFSFVTSKAVFDEPGTRKLIFQAFNRSCTPHPERRIGCESMPYKLLVMTGEPGSAHSVHDYVSCAGRLVPTGE